MTEEAGQVPVTRATPVVDIHCHTFNGADLPVEGSVEHVSLRDKDWVDWVKARLLWCADRTVQRDKYGFEPERTVLDPDDCGVPRWSAGWPPGAAVDMPVVRGAGGPGRPRPHRGRSGYRRGAGRGSSRPRRQSPGLAASMAFARNLASTRLDVARRLVDTYPDVYIFTPMLVDMVYGVDDAPATTVAQQIDLHEKISRLSILGKFSHRKALLLLFVGFDLRAKSTAQGRSTSCATR